jgi:1,4-alpha-glucan branching enzyme
LVIKTYNLFLSTEITPEDSAAVSSAGFDCTWIHSSFFETAKYMAGDRALGKVQHVLGPGNGFSKPTQMLKYLMGCHDQIGDRNNGAFDHDIGGFHR